MKGIGRKAVLVVMLLCMCLLTVQPALADQEGPDVLAGGYCVLNLRDGSVIFQKDMNERFYPASITKVMTALVTLEHCTNFDDKVVFNQEVMDSITSNSSTLNPVAVLDEEMTVRDALFGLMLNSANECASALAVYTAGSIDAFVDMMNEKAQELGAVNTHFMNAHGLHDDEHYTTAYDMALIFKAALENDNFRYIDSSSSYTIPATNKYAARECNSTNQFLNGTFEYEGVYAGKTGSTPEAGKTLVTAAYRDGVALISVVLKSDQDHYYRDTATLLDHAFAKAMGTEGEVFTATDDFVMVSSSLASGLRVREYPSTYSEAVASLSAGESVYRIGTFGNWSLVQTPIGNYYVSSEFLTNQDGTPVSLTEISTALSDPQEAVTEPDLSSRAANEPMETKEPGTTEAEVQTTEAVSVAASVQAEPSQAQSAYPAQHYTYQLNADILTVAIVAVVVLIAIIVGILGIIVIRRKG